MARPGRGVRIRSVFFAGEAGEKVQREEVSHSKEVFGPSETQRQSSSVARGAESLGISARTLQNPPRSVIVRTLLAGLFTKWHPIVVIAASEDVPRMARQELPGRLSAAIGKGHLRTNIHAPYAELQTSAAWMADDVYPFSPKRVWAEFWAENWRFIR